MKGKYKCNVAGSGSYVALHTGDADLKYPMHCCVSYIRKLSKIWIPLESRIVS